MFPLPKEIIRTIYALDPTYHRIQWRVVVKQLRTTLALREVFTNHITDLIWSPFYKYSVLRHFRKEDIKQYAHTRGIKIYQRITKSRLLTLLVWFELQQKAITLVIS